MSAASSGEGAAGGVRFGCETQKTRSQNSKPKSDRNMNDAHTLVGTAGAAVLESRALVLAAAAAGAVAMTDTMEARRSLE